MTIILWGGLAILALFAFDQIALWAERKGYVRYRKGKPNPVTAALDGIESSLNPGATPLTKTEEDLPEHKQP